MKRYISFFLAFIILISTPFNSFAAKKKFERETINITDGISGKEYTVKVVHLIMGGDDVISDVPGMLFESRTLVPVRFISENLGAQVSWDQDERKATIKTDEKEIILKIDSPKVLVNGEEYTLPDGVPAKLIGYEDNFRTMVPLRFVSEQLGMEVGWIAETMTATIDKPMQYVKNIQYDGTKKFPEIILSTTGEVEISSFFLEGSEVGGEDRIVIDLPNTKLDIQDESIVDSNGLVHIDVLEDDIKAIRASQFEIDPYKTRVVIDMEKRKGYETFYDEEKNELRIKFINSVKDIKIDKMYDVDTVAIKTAEEPIYNIMFLKGKIVVDILNSLMKYEGDPIEVNRGGIKGVRFSQFNPDKNYEPDDVISRVVVDIEEGVTAEDIYIEHIDNELFVYVAGNPLDGLDYFKEDINIANLTISTNEETKYIKRYDEDDRELILKIPKEKIDLDTLDVDIDDNIIENIKVDDKKSNKYYYINIKLVEGTKIVDKSKGEVTNEIALRFINDKLIESEYKDKLIVIDAGHGGKDPGAISPNLNIKEKDVVLEVSLKLKKLLEKAGFKVYLTREDDSYIGLYDRTTIANELGADAFVSIHVNAHPRSDVDGVQVLYYPDGQERDNKTFAAIMRDALCEGLGARNRGIIERPRLVVTRETKMPAVLLELGFLTNSREEKLLSTSEYRTKAAEASYKGIIEYFNNVLMK
ncbi:MAG: N-acetylmuramoyl-L-alanine amidase [Candidatus Petromonas sp.]|jgi:N-acetylmuramoyl-L-alanine amidase|nr:N-acetylmuramoyl-L-alanine amidase [Candidatus Petromonas sp.]